jgi:chemotaxis family two-component system sensor kinase Cph1
LQKKAKILAKEMTAEIRLKGTELKERNKDLQDFAYIASHDLQEPLRTVYSFTELLKTEYYHLFDEIGKQSVDFIIDATSRMRGQVKGLLEFARLGKNPEMHPINCDELIGNVQKDLEVIIKEVGVTINVRKLPAVNGLPNELRLLFQNLLSNAIKFKKPDVAPLISISAEKINSFWQFKVSDNGIVIPDKHTDKIFQIFQRLHEREIYEGTGIGLAYCKKIVELHSGEIWVKSQEGKGSDFYFTIPV